MYHQFLKQIEDYIFVEDAPQKADVIFVPGNGFPQMAEKAAELYCEGYAPYVLPSGRYSKVVGHFAGVMAEQERYDGVYETEWEFLKNVLQKNGVPGSAILREDLATYTCENAAFSRKVTDAAGLRIKRAILCCKTHHARRALMYYQLEFPETEILVCPVCTDGVKKETWHTTNEGIDTVMGEVTRIIRQFSLMMGR